MNREFAYRFSVICTQTLFGPRALISHFTLKMTQPLFQVVIVIFYWIFRQNTSNYTQKGTINRKFAYSFSVIRTQTLIGPQGPYFPFHVQNATTTVPTRKLLFLLDIPLEHLKLHLERSYKQRVRQYVFSNQHTNIDWPQGPYIPFHFENDTTTVPSG